jgi:hypothetical protein
LNSLLNEAWKAVCDEPSDKLVLIYLADRANTKGQAWPHLPTISRETGLCKRTIMRTIERLATRGHLVVERKAGCSNRYTVHPVSHAHRGDTKSPVTLNGATRDTESPQPVTQSHQHPNPKGTIRERGRISPHRKRATWQLLRDEKSIKERLDSERESCKPNKALIESLRTELGKVRAEMTETRP